MDLSIIIVSWNVKEKLYKCLSQLLSSRTKFKFEIVIVDNASYDGSAEMVKNNFPEIKLIENGENFGFARANNQAFRLTTGDFIFLLNPDTFVFPGTIESFLQWLKSNENVSLAGCHLLDEKGASIKGQVRKFPGLFDQLAVIFKLPYLFPGILNRYLCVNFDYKKAAPVETVRGSAMMIRRSALEKALPYSQFNQKQLLDERYFAWFEDVDICQTFKSAGEEVWYTPAASCLDLVGQSFGQLSRLRAQKLFRNSMLKYFKKWKPFWQYAIIWLAWPVGITLAFIFSALKFKKKDNT